MTAPPCRAGPPASEHERLPPVTIVANDIGPVGGMELQLTRLIEGLIAIGHPITVVSRRCHIAGRPEVRWIKVPGPTRPFPIAAPWFFAAGGTLARLRGRGIVHSTGAIVFNRVDVATVHFCHHAAADAPGPARTGRASAIYRLNAALSARLARLGERLCYSPRRLRRVVGVASGVSREIERYFPKLRSQIETIPNGVDHARFSLRGEVRARARAEVGLRSRDLAALFVGSDWERKGLREAIWALGVATRGKLLVVGKGDRPTYEKVARSAGVSSRVTFLGAKEEPAPYYAAGDALVLPTAYEAFSLVSLEAAAGGLPLVMTDVNGVDEILEDGRNGWVVDRSPRAVADALTRLEDERLRASMGAHSREAAASFRWDEVARRYSDLYHRLWEQRRLAAS